MPPAKKAKKKPAAPTKKHPCPDCSMCQQCSDTRCNLCKGWLVGCCKTKRPAR